MTRRKLNIWIVYADIFSNLTTFLFISAIGVFAAFGSGVIGRGGVGSAQQCKALSVVGNKAVEVEESWYTVNHLGQDFGRCVTHLIINSEEYKTDFHKDDNVNFKSEEISNYRRKICIPVYRSIIHPDFQESQSKINFIGVEADSHDLNLDNQCLSAFDYSISPIGGDPMIYKYNNAAHEIITCLKIDKYHKNSFDIKQKERCNNINSCFDSDNKNRKDTDICGKVRSMENDIRIANEYCLRQKARKAAQKLAALCKEYHYDEHNFDHAEIDLDPSDGSGTRLSDESLQRLWSRVGVDGVVKPASGQGNDGAQVYKDRKAGTVLVEIDFR